MPPLPKNAEASVAKPSMGASSEARKVGGGLRSSITAPGAKSGKGPPKKAGGILLQIGFNLLPRLFVFGRPSKEFLGFDQTGALWHYLELVRKAPAELPAKVRGIHARVAPSLASTNDKRTGSCASPNTQSIAGRLLRAPWLVMVTIESNTGSSPNGAKIT